jgi:hypothetical protein
MGILAFFKILISYYVVTKTTVKLNTNLVLINHDPLRFSILTLLKVHIIHII